MRRSYEHTFEAALGCARNQCEREFVVLLRGAAVEVVKGGEGGINSAEINRNFARGLRLRTSGERGICGVTFGAIFLEDRRRAERVTQEIELFLIVALVADFALVFDINVRVIELYICIVRLFVFAHCASCSG